MRSAFSSPELFAIPIGPGDLAGSVRDRPTVSSSVDSKRDILDQLADVVPSSSILGPVILASDRLAPDMC